MNEVADRRDRQRLRRFASGGVEGFGQTGPDDPAKRIIVGSCGHPCGIEHHVPHSREDAEAERDGSGLEADGLSLSRGPAVGSKTRERLEEPVEDLGLELGEPVLIGRRCKQGGFLGFVPVAGGDFTGGLYYVDSTVKYAEEDADGKYYGVALKYEYPLSKRTSVYGGTGWYKAKVDYSADDVYKEEAYQAYLGLTHCF